jgi:hypothetical protein
MCKRKENKHIDRQTGREREKKENFFSLNENTHDLQIEHTLLFQAT